LPTGGYCDLSAQYQLAYAFDALIGNRARTPDRFLYDADATTLFLSGHGAAFDASTRVAEALEVPLARTGPELLERLRELDPARLKGSLGELLAERDIEALLKRRDRILALARPAAAKAAANTSPRTPARTAAATVPGTAASANHVAVYEAAARVSAER
jgi:hypothetical protein